MKQLLLITLIAFTLASCSKEEIHQPSQRLLVYKINAGHAARVTMRYVQTGTVVVDDVHGQVHYHDYARPGDEISIRVRSLSNQKVSVSVEYGREFYKSVQSGPDGIALIKEVLQ